MYCSLLVLTKVTITLNYRDEAMHAAGNEQCLTFETGYSDIIPSKCMICFTIQGSQKWGGQVAERNKFPITKSNSYGDRV